MKTDRMDLLPRCCTRLRLPAFDLEIHCAVPDQSPPAPSRDYNWTDSIGGLSELSSTSSISVSTSLHSQFRPLESQVHVPGVALPASCYAWHVGPG